MCTAEDLRVPVVLAAGAAGRHRPGPPLLRLRAGGAQPAPHAAQVSIYLSMCIYVHIYLSI